MLLAYDELCFQLTFEEIINEDYLNFSYKEVNTHTLLHSKTAAAYSKAIAIVRNNIDVFVLTFAYADETEVFMCHRRGSIRNKICQF